jgi:hypothetical protein
MKSFLPFHMSVSYCWTDYPYVSIGGFIGGSLVLAVLYIAIRLAGARDRKWRLIAFGLLWYLIVLLPVSNLMPTSTKMADRYLFVPTVGLILAVLALIDSLVSSSWHDRIAVYFALGIVMTVFTAWSYSRTEVWCGKSAMWHGQAQPDLSLWTSAAETNPDDVFALHKLTQQSFLLEQDDTLSEPCLLKIERSVFPTRTAIFECFEWLR